MFAATYDTAIERLAAIAPSLDRPTLFIEWAETVCDVLTTIYSLDYDSVTKDLFDAAKEYQDYEDE